MTLDTSEFSIQRKANLMIQAVPFLPFLLSVISFWSYYQDTFGLLFGFLGHVIFGMDWEIDLTGDIGRSVGFVVFTTLFQLAFYLCWVFLIARQALLPVQSGWDVLQSMFHLGLHILGLHGARMNIRNGELDDDPNDLRRHAPGVAVVDHNSAMVLERVTPSGLQAMLLFIFPRMVLDWLFTLVARKRVSRQRAARICGPGLTFIRADERILGVGDLDENSTYVDKISGVVDLRRQFRTNRQPSLSIQGFSNDGLKGYTRDGIELSTAMSVFFSIGHNPNTAPHVLHVTFRDGIPTADNICEVQLSVQNNHIQINNIENTLDEDDKQQIFEKMANDTTEWNVFTPLNVSLREPVFNREQVFSAVYARARNHANNSAILSWTELPVHNALDHFREIISTVNFDELYQFSGNERQKVAELRQRVGYRVRNMGVLSVRFVRRANNRPLKKNSEYAFDDLQVTGVFALTSHKILRDRGIQIISCGFGELLPDESVFRQWLSSWGSIWERDTIILQARAEQEATRLRNRARLTAQEAMASNMEAILADANQPLESSALLLLQALEDAASASHTRPLLADEVTNMLRMIHEMIRPQDFFMPPHNEANP